MQAVSGSNVTRRLHLFPTRIQLRGHHHRASLQVTVKVGRTRPRLPVRVTFRATSRLSESGHGSRPGLNGRPNLGFGRLGSAALPERACTVLGYPVSRPPVIQVLCSGNSCTVYCTSNSWRQSPEATAARNSVRCQGQCNEPIS